ncbi:MAG: dihydrodipicolinate synthase family protein [Fimbriimonas sp.]
MDWTGVIPAMTTKFHEDLTVDHDFTAEHAKWLVDAGCNGVLGLGSLGEGSTLRFAEKVEILKTLVAAVGDRGPVVAGISALSTAEAVELAQEAERVGCKGLMVLPAYVYKGDWREVRNHFETVFRATGLSCMLYNNPIAYGVDILPTQVLELADRNANMHSVKESSADVRRVTEIKRLLGDRLKIFVGVDDLIVEGVAAGATGWIAGLVNAFPEESVRLYNLAMEGRHAEARELYEWFLPLLRLDVVPEFIQLIKLVQQEVGMGTTTVRPPRLELEGPALAAAMDVIREGLANRPQLATA